VFVAAPLVVFLSYSLIGLMLPIVFLPPEQEVFYESNGAPLADLLIISYLLVAARFVLGLAGLDTASPFGGMGSSREMFVNVISEPTLIIATYAMAISSHTTSLPSIIRYRLNLNVGDFLANPSFLLVVCSLYLLMLAETGRLPFDNPDTHLELTMMGKAIALEYSGFLLAFLEWAEAMRLTFFMTLILNLLLPAMISGNEPLGRGLVVIGLYFLRLIGLVVLVAVWELTRVKLRLRAIVNPAVIAFVFSILAVVVAVVFDYFSKEGF